MRLFGVRRVLTSKSDMTKSRNEEDTKRQLLQLHINLAFVFTICSIKMSYLTRSYIILNHKQKPTYISQNTEEMAIRYLETLGYQILDKRKHT